jgi:hypothetical protein
MTYRTNILPSDDLLYKQILPSDDLLDKQILPSDDFYWTNRFYLQMTFIGQTYST